MQILPAHAMCLLTALIVAAGATHAAATPLNPFRYEAQARRHCPVDTVVWLDFRKGIYYFKQQKRYAQGSTGSFRVSGRSPQQRLPPLVAWTSVGPINEPRGL